MKHTEDCILNVLIAIPRYFSYLQYIYLYMNKRLIEYYINFSTVGKNDEGPFNYDEMSTNEPVAMNEKDSLR